MDMPHYTIVHLSQQMSHLHIRITWANGCFNIINEHSYIAPVVVLVCMSCSFIGVSIAVFSGYLVWESKAKKNENTNKTEAKLQLEKHTINQLPN